MSKDIYLENVRQSWHSFEQASVIQTGQQFIRLQTDIK